METKLYKPIIEFFESREKEKKDEQPFEEKLNNAKKLLKTWLLETSQKVGQMSMSTHPCTLTHPGSNRSNISVTEKDAKGKIKSKKLKIKTMTIIASPAPATDGYFRSGNVENIKTDALGNAAVISYFKFINIVLGDGNTVLWHVENNTPEAKELLSNCNKLSYEELRKGIISPKYYENENATSSKIKQVYFPVKDDYHLLSVIMPSGIMSKLTQCIKDMKFGEDVKRIKELRKKNEFSEETLQDIYDLAMVGYGGTKPQNISILNNENAGKFYFLTTKPPFLETRTVKLPGRNFFKDVLWAGFYKNEFISLHNLFKIDVNNQNIRRGRDNIILYIFDDILRKIFAIRSSEIGWSEKERCKNLPKSQKILLDNIYETERSEKPEIITEFLKETARWVVRSYSEIIGKEAIVLADTELSYIKKLITDESEALV